MTVVEALCLCPSLDAAASLLSDSLRKRRFIITIGRCRVEYEGRGASRLGPGDRVVVIKPDGAVLVHRPTGYSPVNWQPTSSIINVESSNDLLVVRSIREKPREILTIYFEAVQLITVLSRMEDTAEFIEYVDEAEIRDYLYENPESLEPGLRPLAREKPVGDGYVDIYAVDKNGNPVVIEVKRVTAGVEAVKQLYRYVETIRGSAATPAKVRGLLVAPNITRDALALLNSLGLEYKRINLQAVYKSLRAKRGTHSKTRGLLDYIAKNRGGAARSRGSTSSQTQPS